MRVNRNDAESRFKTKDTTEAGRNTNRTSTIRAKME